MASKTATYTHGHHASVLRSHSWRTAANSCAYLLPSLQPHTHILDIGCGPGTITADLAALVPEGSVTAVETSSSIIATAEEAAKRKGVKNVRFVIGDIHKLDFADNTFDVVHAHQVLQHVGDPVQALKEMWRVTKPGGLVAARDADYAAMTFFPDSEELKGWQGLYQKVARRNGGEPNAGRMLHAWAKQAGFLPEQVKASASTWCYSTPDEISWWSDLWAERTVASSFAKTAIDSGCATEEDLKLTAKAWRQWGVEEDAWFVVLNGEILCQK